MLRRLGLIAGWAAATVAVVALGWAAVGAVAGTVTDPPPLAQPPLGPTTPPVALAPTTPPVAADEAASPQPTGAPATADPAPPAASPSPEEAAASRTFDLLGGTVGVRVGAGAVELVFATPQPGFSVEVRSRGPDLVEVRFSSEDHESRLRYDPEDGERLEERPD